MKNFSLKKIVVSSFGIFVILATIILTPLSAFAQEDNINNPNEFGVIPYNEYMLIKTRDQYSNDYSNPEYIQQQKDAGILNYDGKFNAKKSLGGIMCFDVKAENYASSFDDEQKRIFEKACDSWKNQKNNILVYNRQNSNTYYYSFEFIFYTGSKKINLEYIDRAIDSYGFSSKGFFAELTSEDYNDFYIVSGEIKAGDYRCYNDLSGLCSAESVDVRVGSSKLFKHYPFLSPYEKKHFFFGTNYTNYATPVFITFDVIYPENYPDQDKIATDNGDKETPPQREKYHPYFWFSVKNKNMKGNIQAFYDSGKHIGVDSANGRIKPVFELYDEKKENKIFEYTGSNLADKFNYDFENYSTFYVKTFVLWDFPAPLAPSARPEIIQPIWTKVVINGSDYAFLNNPNGSDGKCDKDNNCSPPDYVETCSLIKSDINVRFACEFYRLDQAFRKQFGILLLPLDLTSGLIYNFQTKTTVSCSVSNGPLKINACIFEERLPALYTFLNMSANGAIIFAFVIFLRKSLVGFLNSKGDE